jgi:DNA-binding MarR family transcriptional regulator
MKAELGEAQSCFSYALRKAARSVTRTYDAALRSTGLRSTQFNLLVVIDGTGSIGTGALAKIVAIDRTTLTRNIALLERRGLVRTAKGLDRRSRHVSITARGRRAALAALPAWRSAHAALKKSLGAKRFAELATRLAELTANARS